MTALPFDSMIFCGDSWTYNHNSNQGITVETMWPAMVAEHFGLSHVNLGKGGASNYEIALQPVQALSEHRWPDHTQRPLIIFTFTHDYRMPYYDFDLARIDSFFSLNIKRLKGINKYAKAMRSMIERGLATVENRYMPSHGSQELMDGYQHQTRSAIALANGYTKIIPGATVLWGFGHCEFSELEYDQRRLGDQIQQQHYQHLDSCYNEDLPLRRPLQWLSDEHRLWINNANDIHPNMRGLEVYAKVMIDVIGQRFSSDRDK